MNQKVVRINYHRLHIIGYRSYISKYCSPQLNRNSILSRDSLPLSSFKTSYRNIIHDVSHGTPNGFVSDENRCVAPYGTIISISKPNCSRIYLAACPMSLEVCPRFGINATRGSERACEPCLRTHELLINGIRAADDPLHRSRKATALGVVRIGRF